MKIVPPLLAGVLALSAAMAAAAGAPAHVDDAASGTAVGTPAPAVPGPAGAALLFAGLAGLRMLVAHRRVIAARLGAGR